MGSPAEAKRYKKPEAFFKDFSKKGDRSTTVSNKSDKNYQTTTHYCYRAWLFSRHSRAEEAQAQKDQEFGEGIGFYYSRGSRMIALTWTANLNDTQNASDQIVILDPSTSFFSYGMDFSGGGLQGPLPLHLMGYSWGYLRPNNQPQGDWPIGFLPIEGTKQKVYQLRFDGLQTLLAGQTPYRYWYMKVPGNAKPICLGSAIPQPLQSPR